MAVLVCFSPALQSKLLQRTTCTMYLPAVIITEPKRAWKEGNKSWKNNSCVSCSWLSWYNHCTVYMHLTRCCTHVFLDRAHMMWLSVNFKDFWNVTLCRQIHFSYLGGVDLVSIGHHAETSQVFFDKSNFTHDPVWIPAKGKQSELQPSELQTRND